MRLREMSLFCLGINQSCNANEKQKKTAGFLREIDVAFCLVCFHDRGLDTQLGLGQQRIQLFVLDCLQEWRFAPLPYVMHI